MLNPLLLPRPCPCRSDQYVPKRVEAVRHVALVAGGWRHTLAADREGRVYACGWNKFGQCGVGSTEDVVTPQQVQGLDGERVVQLKSGWKHTLAVTDSGKLYSWGRNVNGQVRGGSVHWCLLLLSPPFAAAAVHIATAPPGAHGVVCLPAHHPLTCTPSCACGTAAWAQRHAGQP